MQRESKTDVLIIGGGTAGFGAAVAAGRRGLRTVLIEATSKVGGVMAFCPGMPWGAGYPAGSNIGGIFAEVTARLMALDPPAAERRPCTLENFGDEVLYDHDIATLTLFEMLEEAGVTTRLNATAVVPEMAGARIVAVQCHDRHGPFRITPRIVIDCSGDGDISAKAGVPHKVGDAQGNMMGVTLSFHMNGVDCDRAFADPDPYFTAHAARGIAGGALHPDLAKLYLMRGFHPGTVFCNSVVIRGIDGTDPAQITAATQEGRRRAHQLARFLRAEVPGFENAWMSGLGPTVGVRETRKLAAVLQVTGEDLARATKFPDGVVACDNPVDDVMRADASMTHDAIVEAGRYYTIPFRALVPERVQNLLFAGRLISADPVAFASVRGMPQCMAMGQAAGTAAAQVLETGSNVQDIDTARLVEALTAQGVSRLSPVMSDDATAHRDGL